MRHDPPRAEDRPSRAEAVRLARAAGPRPRAALRLWDGTDAPGLPLARAHEICGTARIALAAIVAGRAADGPVLWIRPAHAEGRPNPDGLAPFMDPARLVLALPGREPDVLWCAEEALRAGACPVVIAEPPAPPRLTPVRRLHLAAEAGAERAAGRRAPLCLLLTAEGGAEGVETRWRVAPAVTGAGRESWVRGGAPRWRLERAKARMAAPTAWEVAWDGGLRPLGAGVRV